jgi:hypothetical protein
MAFRALIVMLLGSLTLSATPPADTSVSYPAMPGAG